MAISPQSVEPKPPSQNIEWLHQRHGVLHGNRRAIRGLSAMTDNGEQLHRDSGPPAAHRQGDSHRWSRVCLADLDRSGAVSMSDDTTPCSG